MCHHAIKSFQTLKPLSPPQKHKVMAANCVPGTLGSLSVLTCPSPGSPRQCRSCSPRARCLCPRRRRCLSWPRWWESRRWPRLSGTGSSASSGGRDPEQGPPQPPRWAGCGSPCTGLACPPWLSRPLWIFAAPVTRWQSVSTSRAIPQVTLSLGRSGRASSYSCRVVGSKDTGWNGNPLSQITIWSAVKWKACSQHWLGDKWYRLVLVTGELE